jgi:hypothetical protein
MTNDGLEVGNVEGFSVWQAGQVGGDHAAAGVRLSWLACWVSTIK